MHFFCVLLFCARLLFSQALHSGTLSDIIKPRRQKAGSGRRKMDIRQIDKNFLQDSGFDAKKVKFYGVTEKPFALYGIFYDEECGRFLRMPAKTASAVSEGVAALNANTAGGRVRFSTDSEQLVCRTCHCRGAAASLCAKIRRSGKNLSAPCGRNGRMKRALSAAQRLRAVCAITLFIFRSTTKFENSRSASGVRRRSGAALHTAI